MIEIYGEFYFSQQKKNPGGTEKYSPVKSSVARSILLSLYDNSILEKEIVPIEEISQEIKNKYWEFSKEIFPNKEQRITSCKCMYVLDYITGSV